MVYSSTPLWLIRTKTLFSLSKDGQNGHEGYILEGARAAGLAGFLSCVRSREVSVAFEGSLISLLTPAWTPWLYLCLPCLLVALRAGPLDSTIAHHTIPRILSKIV